MPMTATTPARSVAVFGIVSTGTFVTSSMIAATDIITISMTIGIASALFAPGSVRSAGKNPNTTTSATPARKISADALAAGASGGRSPAPLGAGILPAASSAWYSGSSFEVLAEEHRHDRREYHAGQRGRHADHQDLRQAPLRSCPSRLNRPIMAAVAAATGLAVIACCDAIVATAIGRSGRMPFWCAVS